MRIKGASAPLDRARHDTRQAIADANTGCGPSLGRTVVLLARLWLGTKLLQIVWGLGL